MLITPVAGKNKHYNPNSAISFASVELLWIYTRVKIYASWKEKKKKVLQ